MNLPIPSHLINYLIASGDANNELEVTGEIQCSCSNHEHDKFEIYESNDKSIIKLICTNCKKDIILFDEGKHGWNGFVCKDDFLDRTLAFSKALCTGCQSDIFKVNMHISSQGKQDFIDECVSDDDSFSPEQWVDAFEWITISPMCINCNKLEDGWADFETM